MDTHTHTHTHTRSRPPTHTHCSRATHTRPPAHVHTWTRETRGRQSSVCGLFFLGLWFSSNVLRAQHSSVEYLICFWREPWVFIERATCTTFISRIFDFFWFGSFVVRVARRGLGRERSERGLRQFIVSILFERVEDDGIQADTEETGSPGTGSNV